ncbi:MAG: branched-chain amino acid ABC transporter permease [Anaerolineales bacterium]|nr:branched-chain amino acid ABC transporter permease [Anaerolineales bacterium]
MSPFEADEPSARAEFFAGVRAQFPLLIGVSPFAMIFGALALASGIPAFETQGFSLFVFAGSAQFIATGLIADGIPPLIVVLTIFIVNLRHALYSASISPHTHHLSRPWKAVLAWLLTDEAFAAASLRYQRQVNRHTHWFTFGTGLTLWLTWQISTAIGILLGTGIPEEWSLDFALPLTFMALLTPALISHPAWISATVAGISSVALGGLPYRLGLLSAVILGVLAGLVTEFLRPSSEEAVG